MAPPGRGAALVAATPRTATISDTTIAAWPFGAWVAFVPRSAGPRPWLTVIAVGQNGRVLSREPQRG